VRTGWKIYSLILAFVAVIILAVRMQSENNVTSVFGPKSEFQNAEASH
jgi:Flp pilus assembly pilin Flp